MSTVSPHPESSSASAEERLRACHTAMVTVATGKPPSYRERQADLDRLRHLVLDHREEIITTLQHDFRHRARGEIERLEILPTILAIRHAQARLRSWMRPQRRVAHWASWPSRIKVVPQPLGVVGIISPWNYPLLLTLGAVVGAVAAGNRVMIKISEHAPTYASLFARLVAESFPPEKMSVFEGGVEVAQAFAELPLDHLLFTGSTSVGRMVLRAAAENLTPVTLELGGKSPAVIDRDYAFTTATLRSLVMGKMYNAGQTCVAPDYLLVHSSDIERVVETIRSRLAEWYPKLAGNDDYTAIINDRHHARLRAAVEDARAKGARILEINPAREPTEAFSIKLPLTLVLGVTDDMVVAREEIFGPILPIVPYDSLDQAIAYINARPRPLAAYVYTHDRAVTRRLQCEVVAGALAVNQSAIHVGIETLPFGGVGASGMGNYHGYEGFVTFSHMKAVYQQLYPNFFGVFAPPYESKLKRRVLDLLIRL